MLLLLKVVLGDNNLIIYLLLQELMVNNELNSPYYLISLCYRVVIDLDVPKGCLNILNLLLNLLGS
jgi:hypothetical protein